MIGDLLDTIDALPPVTGDIIVFLMLCGLAFILCEFTRLWK